MLKELNLSWLIRYGYGGGLLYLILLLTYTDSVKAYTEAAGPVLSPLIVLAGGACIYVVYRHLLGEWVLYPAAHLFDWLTSAENKAKGGAVSAIWYLAQQKVPFGKRREAYTALRREYLTSETKKQLDLAHSEVHVLYITFLELLVLALLLSRTGQAGIGRGILIGSLAFLIAAWAADVRLHRHEFRTIVPQDSTKRGQVEGFLRDRGYIT